MDWRSLALVALVAGCGMSEWRPPQEADRHEDPKQIRSGYGNDQLHMWWPITDAEIVALQGIDKARAGDAHALFALAVYASATVRDASGYARYAQRFDQFIDDARADMEHAGDDRARGDFLNRRMHKVFFTGSPNPSDAKMGAYSLDQARLTGIFDEGHYNCISSALLYTTLARAFSLPVRGVLTTTHAFVELDSPSPEQAADVETTYAEGYGHVHDAKFYAEQAAQWSSSRGLKPMTLDDYKKREIVPPYAFVARAMNDKRVVNDETQGRLSEAAAMMEPDNDDLQWNRMASYSNEAKWLFEHNASRTTVRFLEVTAPVISEVADKHAGNAKLMSAVAWMAFYNARALIVTGRGDEAVAIANDALDHLSPTWEGAKLLRDNFVGVLSDRLTELQGAGQHEKSIAVVTKHLTDCMQNDACQNNLYVTFDRWSSKFQSAGNDEAAKRVLKTCIGLISNDTRCHAALDTLSGR